ncbi:unnamed protein product [Phytophthora lilii]|uniref:RxLR effector protein n=1 Tax=Phytophthora lilii TaxID=2077276 RepID=A0A9W6UC11_9STRA|nr:unnamed protein product [Phytophthora lilii]
MRLLLWVLVVTLVTFLSSSDAASTDSNKKQVAQLESGLEFMGRDLAAENAVSDDTRLLRSENKKTVDTADENDREERVAILSGTSNAVRRVLAKIQAKIDLIFDKKFREYMENGMTPADVKKEFEPFSAMSWRLSSRDRHYVNRYETWLRTKYPDSPLLKPKVAEA